MKGSIHRRRKWARRPFGPPGPIDFRADPNYFGAAQSIAMIVVTPELILTECNRCSGCPALRLTLLHGSKTLGMCRVEPGRPFGRPAHVGWQGGSDAHGSILQSSRQG